MLPALASFVAGDALSVTVPPFSAAGADISAAGGYTLALALRGAKSLNLSCAPANADASGAWVLNADSAATKALPAGIYAFVYTATSANGNRLTVSSGQVEVQPDLTAATDGFDARTTAQQALEQAEAALAAFKGSGGRIKQYTIAGRTVTYDTVADILSTISYWKAKVLSEGAAARAAQGLGNPSTLRVRFTR